MPIADPESVLALQATDVHPDLLSKAIHADRRRLRRRAAELLYGRETAPAGR